LGQQHRSGKTVKEQRPCWDEKTQASFAERDCFDVYIHQRNEGDRLRQSTTQNIAGTRGYEISGLLVYPPWQAELKVDESDGDFGLWFLSLLRPRQRSSATASGNLGQ